jgi:anti-anti-sigma regulatory factor
MWVFVGEKFACIRISGRANFTSSIDFKTLVTELKAKGYNFFVLDLKDCTLMDSTFLGVLAGFGLKMGGNDRNAVSGRIELRNPNNRILELLENLGVLHLFALAQGDVPMPEEAREQECRVTTPTREEQTLACIEAHEILSSLSEENAARFKDVSQFLAEDLKRIRSVRT